MSRPLRIHAPGLSYHVTGRGNNKMTMYRDVLDYRRFLEILTQVVDDFAVDCHAFCLMVTHYHLVITTRQPNISAAIKHLNGQYAQWWNKRHKRVGHVFQGRFGAKVVQDGEYLLRACRYTVLNPVRARAVELPEQWRWSSYRPTAGLAPVPAFLRCEVIWRTLAGDREDRRFEAYRQYVATPDPEATQLLRKAVCGDAEFVANFRNWRDRASREVPRREREEGRPDLDTIFAGAVSRKQRYLAAARAWEGGYHFAQIAAFLGVDRTTANRMVARGQVCRMPHRQT